MFITLQANCRALIKHTHRRTHSFLHCLWTAEFLLKIDLQAVVCAASLRNSLPLCHALLCHTHTHTHTLTILRTQHASKQSRPVEQNNTLSLRIFEMQTNKRSDGREGKTGRRRKRKGRKRRTEMGWEEGETNRPRDGLMVTMRRVAWQENSKCRKVGKSGKHPSVSDNCLMVAVLKAVCDTSLHFIPSSPFHGSPSPSPAALSSSQTHYFDKSLPYLPPSFSSFHLTLPVSIHSLSRPWRPSLSCLFICSCFIYLFLCFKVTIMYTRGKLNSGWMIHSLFSFSLCVLTKTALIEIQPHASQPAKCPWKPCSEWSADEDTKRER